MAAEEAAGADVLMLDDGGVLVGDLTEFGIGGPQAAPSAGMESYPISEEKRRSNLVQLINGWGLEQLKVFAEAQGISTKGSINALRKRLREFALKAG